MMAEFLPSRSRGRWLVALEGFWAVGTVAAALIAWMLQSLATESAWRWLLGSAALPALIGICFRLSIPESPLFLLKAGNTDGANSVLRQIAAANGRSARSSIVPAFVEKREGRRGLLSSDLRRKTILITAIWLLFSISYYGVFTWLPARLTGTGFGFVRGYGFLLLMALAQIPGYALAAFGVERWGRRSTLITFIFLSAAGCLAFAVTTNPAQIAAAIMTMASRCWAPGARSTRSRRKFILQVIARPV
jgi:putative MFS transporter